MKALKNSHDVEVYWRSYELRPKGSPPISPEYLRRIEASRPRFIQSMRENYGVDIQAGPFGINSRLALIGEKYAEAQGKGDDYHEAMSHAYWQEGRNIEELDVLKDVAAQVGFDPDAFAAALQDPRYEAAVIADIRQAYDYGLSGVPALVFENKYLVSGAQPYAVLAEVTENVEAEKETDEN